MSVALITGGSGGIGAACARLFADRGLNVIIQYYSNRKAAEYLAQELNSQRPYAAYPLRCDVSDERQVERMFETAYDIFPSLDALICCAGVSLNKLNADTAASEWDNLFGINVKGTFLCCREAVKYMINKRRGKIVTMSSVWGICGAALETAYSASKGAVIAYTKALAKELGTLNINVNCVAPGAVKTPMLDCYTEYELEDIAQASSLNRIGTPQDIAEAAYYLASNAADFITGQVLSPNGGFLI